MTFTLGPLEREALGLLLLAAGALTLLSLLSITSGSLSAWWAGWLRRIFGWGAFPVAAALGAVGGLMLLHNVRPTPQVRWETVIGLEVVFVTTLALAHLIAPGDDALKTAQAGGGGGYIGWAISTLLLDLLGRWQAAAVLAVLGFAGLVLIFNLGWTEMQVGLSYLAAGLQSLRDRLSPVEVLPADGVVESSAQPRKKRRQPSSPESTLRSEPMAEKKLRKRKPAGRQRSRRAGLPPLDLLNRASPRAYGDTDARRKTRIIEETLASFGVPARVVEVNRGPVVTQFGIEPGYVERVNRDGEITQRKIRVSKISALVNDLALALAAAPIRIEAPVPGRPLVGIEVPNERVALVSLREVVESESFREQSSPLAIALGKDVSGQPLAADLGLMPHLLIAGATGSGKSVCINSIISCLLFNNAPQDLQLLMIDPKMVELVNYNGIPHLVAPVVVELDQVVGALTWAVRQMDERYRMFADTGARNIDEYNQKARRRRQDTLPYIVVVIDELADLMMVAPDAVERLICRIAQMARATGIHLVIATQRPSVDVVTGLIKANFPARISFAVTSQVDSRVILDTSGAEHLLGRGDMLVMLPDSSRLLRLQGCFVSDAEIDRLVSFWKEATAAEEARPGSRYPWMAMMVAEEKEDDLMERAIALVQKQKRASTSFLQRRLHIGYPRAARLIDALEEMGIVGPDEGGGRSREVLVHEFEEEETGLAGLMDGVRE